MVAEAHKGGGGMWWSRRAVFLHLVLALCLPSFFVLAYWQLGRALQGNVLSWAYTVEWPFFAGYAVWMWWRLLHDESPVPRRHNVSESTLSVSAEERGYDPYNDDEDPELAAYNRYLASLHAADKRTG